MNRLLKLCSVILCICITWLCVFIPVSATTDPLIFANDSICQSGDIVEIPLLIQSNTGFMGIGLEISYNSDYLTPISVTAGQLLDNGMTSDSISSSAPGSFNIFWAGTENMIENGEIFTLVFSASSDISRNETIKITVLQDDTFDEDYYDVVIEAQDISLSITGAVAQAIEDVSLSVLSINNGERIDVMATTESLGVTVDSHVGIFYNSEALTFINLSEDGAQISDITANNNSVSFRVQSVTTTDKILFSLHFLRASDNEAQLVFSGSASPLNNTIPLRIISTAHTLNKSGIKIYTDTQLSGKYETDFDIPIYISNNSGIMGYKLIFQYDPDSIKPFTVASANLFNGTLENSLGEVNSGEFSVIWCGTENQTNNGKLFTIHCHTITDEIKTIPFVISYSEIDTFDEYLDSVELTCLPSSIKLNQIILGDINGDMEIDSQDLVLLIRHLLGIDLLSDNMDVDQNKTVDIRDLIRLKKIISGVVF